jgi:hypothetical protein
MAGGYLIYAEKKERKRVLGIKARPTRRVGEGKK